MSMTLAVRTINDVTILGELRLMSVTKRISDLLLITNLVTVFEVNDNEGGAVSSF